MASKRLEDIVSEYIDEEGDESTQNFRRYLGLAIRGFRKIHMQFAGMPTTRMCIINENTMSFNTPSDLIRILRVATIDRGNNLRPLKYRDGMILNESPSRGWGIGGHTSIGHYFGRAQVTGASYRANISSNTIKVSSGIGSGCVYLEYLADLKKIDGKYLIHPYAYEAIIAYIRYANVRSSPNRAMSEKQLYKQIWEEERRESVRMYKAQTVQEIFDSYRAIPRS